MDWKWNYFVSCVLQQGSYYCFDGFFIKWFLELLLFFVSGDSGFISFLFGFSRQSSLYSPVCPRVHYIDQFALELRDLLASWSEVLGLKTSLTTAKLYVCHLLLREFWLKDLTIISFCHISFFIPKTKIKINISNGDLMTIYNLSKDFTKIQIFRSYPEYGFISISLPVKGWENNSLSYVL